MGGHASVSGCWREAANPPTNQIDTSFIDEMGTEVWHVSRTLGADAIDKSGGVRIARRHDSRVA